MLGAVAAISALSSARLSAITMPGTLSSVTRPTERSISVKTNQATVLARIIPPASAPKAAKSFPEIPKTEPAAPFGSTVFPLTPLGSPFPPGVGIYSLPSLMTPS